MPTWLILSWALTVGYIPSQVQGIGDNGLVVAVLKNKNAFETTLECSAELAKHIRVDAGVKTYEHKAGGSPWFSPYRADYTFGLALFADGFELGVKHECDHHVLSSPTLGPWYGMTETEIYCKISGATK